jgi:hypothetical protein
VNDIDPVGYFTKEIEHTFLQVYDPVFDPDLADDEHKSDDRYYLIVDNGGDMKFINDHQQDGDPCTCLNHPVVYYLKEQLIVPLV